MIGMSDEKTNVSAMRLTAAVAEARIRKAALVTANVKTSFHAREQMAAREIFDKDMLRVLRGGYVDTPPERTEFEGEWKCKITLKIRGGRTAGVVVIILPNGKLFVKTVEWEDLS
jgi:hypothetical protein